MFKVNITQITESKYEFDSWILVHKSHKTHRYSPNIMKLVKSMLYHTILHWRERPLTQFVEKKLVQARYKSAFQGLSFRQKLIKKFHKEYNMGVCYKINKTIHWVDLMHDHHFIPFKKMVIDYNNLKAISDIKRLSEKSFLHEIECFHETNKLKCSLHPPKVIYADDASDEEDKYCCDLSIDDKIKHRKLITNKFKIMLLRIKANNAINYFKLNCIKRIKDKEKYKRLWKLVLQRKKKTHYYWNQIALGINKVLYSGNNRVKSDKLWMKNNGFLKPGDNFTYDYKHSTPDYFVNGKYFDISRMRKMIKNKHNTYRKTSIEGKKIFLENVDYLKSIQNGRRAKKPFDPGIPGKLSYRIFNVCQKYKSKIITRTLTRDEIFDFHWFVKSDWFIIQLVILY